jgi:hypothetical protein
MKIKSWFAVTIFAGAIVLSAGCRAPGKAEQVTSQPQPAAVIGAIPNQDDPRNWFDYDTLD